MFTITKKKKFLKIIKESEKHLAKYPINTTLTRNKKGVIFYYTDEGYKEINEKLRENKKHELEECLNEALDDLPDYEGIIYRGVSNLSKEEVQKYEVYYKNNEHFERLDFQSYSKEITNAEERLDEKENVLFILMPPHNGKSIYEFSKWRSENEVLVKSRQKFKIIRFKKLTTYTEITLEQIL
jgi:hypothetical protein